ncbi:hypothetical protein LSAT2_005546 [Lamellibrachia satsuma]|nr:hypothetical protein LSAT2_005546 [Lamellibrachia satsuma]
MANTIRLGYTLLRKKAMINQSRINGQQHSMTTNLTENAKLVDYVTLRLEDELTSGEYPNVRLSTIRSYKYRSTSGSSCRLKTLMALEKQVAVYALLVTSACIATANDPVSLYKFCVRQCDNIFLICVQGECPERTWPLPVSNKCTEERTKKISMYTVHCKPSTSTFEPFAVYACLVVIVTTTCYASVYESCLDACRIIFCNCLKRECPGRRWPLPVTQRYMQRTRHRTPSAEVVQQCSSFIENNGNE